MKRLKRRLFCMVGVVRNVIDEIMRTLRVVGVVKSVIGVGYFGWILRCIWGC